MKDLIECVGEVQEGSPILGPTLKALFTRPSAVRRHTFAPLLAERESFLTNRIREGCGREAVMSMAAALLQVVHGLRLSRLRPVGMDEILAAGNLWATAPRSRIRGRSGVTSKVQFVTAARLFLKFHGFLEPALVFHPFQRELDFYMESLVAQRAFTPVTMKSHKENIGRFLKWIGTRRESLREIGAGDVIEYQHLKSSSCAPGTIKNISSPIAAFFAFAEGQGWCAFHVAEAFRMMGKRSRGKRTACPSWPDVRRLLAPDTQLTTSPHRARALLSLCSLYGLRASEVAKLQLGQIDWREEIITVRRSKNHRTQQFPLQYEVAQAIYQYLAEERPRSSSSKALFLTITRPYRPVAAYHVTAVARWSLAKLGIEVSRSGAHCLRHACATQLLRSGSSLKEIADFLGHNGVRTVSLYVRHDTASLEDVGQFKLANCCDL